MEKAIYFCSVGTTITVKLKDGSLEHVTDKERLKELGFIVKGEDIIIHAHTCFRVLELMKDCIYVLFAAPSACTHQPVGNIYKGDRFNAIMRLDQQYPAYLESA